MQAQEKASSKITGIDGELVSAAEGLLSIPLSSHALDVLEPLHATHTALMPQLRLELPDLLPSCPTV